MPDGNQNIAILFFTRTAEAEATAKDFSGNAHVQKNTRLAKSLIKHTQQKIAQANLPIFVFDENRQQGNTFGERFTHAFQAIFSEGFDHVIAVGNDTPQLKSTHITQAAHKLQTGNCDIVLGPADDGGTWLTALSKKAFDQKKFQAYQWQTNTLLSSILDNNEEYEIHTLSLFADIDDAHSLKLFIKQAPQKLRRLVNILRSIIASVFFDRKTITYLTTSAALHSTNLLRAPPIEK